MSKSDTTNPPTTEDAGRICFGAGWRLPASKPAN